MDLLGPTVFLAKKKVAMTANCVRLIFQTTARCFQRILPIFQSLPFWSGRCHFRPFGINAAHFMGSSFLITLLRNGPFASNSFFGQKLSPKVAIIETKSAAVALFLLLLSFSSLFLFLLSFSFVTVILELLGLKKPAFWCLFAQMTANFVRLVFKKSARHTYVQTYLPPR